MGAGESRVLPPWHQSEGVEYAPDITSRIQTLSTTAAPFLHANPQYWAPFELEAHLPRLQGALTFDRNIAQWYPKLVPRKVGEQEFWRNYFSHVAAIVTEGQAQEAAGEEETGSSISAGVAAVAESLNGDANVAASALGPLDPPAAAASSVPAPAPSTPKQTRSQLVRPAPTTPPQLAGLHSRLSTPQSQAQSGTNGAPAPMRLLDLNVSVPAAIIPPSIDVKRLPELRWGVVGCGSALQSFTVPALLQTPGARVVAVTCRTPESREAFALQFGVSHSHVHASLAALLADAQVDAVYIATPPGSHAALAAEVARARKPCVLEKCMARSGEECKAIMEEFERASVPLYVNQHKRMLPRFLAVQQMLRSHVGTVHSVRYDLSNDLALQLHESASGAATAAAPAHAPNWRLDAEQSGGGLFMEFGSELFDVIDFLFGPVTHVQGDAVHSPLGPHPPTLSHALENVVSASFRVRDPSAASASAAISTAGLGASTPAPAPALCTASFNFVVGHQHDSLVIQGSKAQLSLSMFGGDAPVLRFHDGSTATVRLQDVDNPHAAFLAAVCDELRVWRASPSSPSLLALTSGPTAVRTSRVLDGVLRHYYRHRDDAFWQRPHTWQHGLDARAT